MPASAIFPTLDGIELFPDMRSNGDYLVERYAVPSGFGYCAWEPAKGHRTTRRINNRVYGMIGRRPLHPALRDPNGSNWLKGATARKLDIEQEVLAHRLICETYPEAKSGRKFNHVIVAEADNALEVF